MSEAFIKFEKVTKRFGDLTVLDGISFTINKGETTTFIGKSGMGKSVIFKHIIGLMEPDSGSIIFDGYDLSAMKDGNRKKFRSRVGYLFQHMALFDAMTVFDNIALPLREKTKLTESEIRNKVTENLEKLDILDTANKYPSEISGGMQKRVGLARALIRDPEIVLFDEPTTGLDPVRKGAVHSMISHMQRKFNFTAIVISHEIPAIFDISQKILMLDNGRILADCTPEEIDCLDNATVTDFVRGEESLKDDMTGLSNKKSIKFKFDETKSQTAITHCHFSLLVFQINALDEINENLGFVFGQKVIQHLATYIENLLPDSCHKSRYSNDMLVTILPGTGLAETQDLIKKLAASMKKCPDLPPKGYKPMKYSVSAGAAEEKECGTIDDVIDPALANMTIIGEFELD